MKPRRLLRIARNIDQAKVIADRSGVDAVPTD
jgi:hypothetical protein